MRLFSQKWTGIFRKCLKTVKSFFWENQKKLAFLSKVECFQKVEPVERTSFGKLKNFCLRFLNVKSCTSFGKKKKRTYNFLQKKKKSKTRRISKVFCQESVQEKWQTGFKFPHINDDTILFLIFGALFSTSGFASHHVFVH